MRIFLAAHQRYLSAGKDLDRKFEETYRELRRAMGITPSSERRRSGAPLSSAPRGGAKSTGNAQERLAAKLNRSDHLGLWHLELSDRHDQNSRRMSERLKKMREEAQGIDRLSTGELAIAEEMSVEEIELTPEQKAAAAKGGKEFVAHLEEGEGFDPEFQSVNEALMPEDTVVTTTHAEHLVLETSEELVDAKVVKKLKDKRVRYDIAISVSRLELEVEKQVIEKENGERTVVSATTDGYGPARYQVTWSSLATLFSCVGKRFTAGGLSRLLHYVAERLVAIYITLGEQLSDSEILGGDDTSCRVLEVNRYFEQQERSKRGAENRAPPWADYRTPESAKASKLGVGARYILKHYDKLTKYLDDPRLEPNNNLRERMLRTEKLIEKSSMFRKSLEGRFVLDIVRTVLQTAVASGVPVRDYLMSVLRADPKEVTEHPERFTPLAYATRTASEQNS